MRNLDILNKKWFKILLKITIVVVLLVVVWLVWKKIVTKDSSIPDNIRFSKDYTQVSEDNIYKYASKKEVLSAFDSEKAVVFFGFPECKWCQAYVKLLNDIAKEYGVNEILYYNIKYDRSKNTKFYKQVQELTKDYLQEDEEIPCDCVVLYSSNPNGICYIQVIPCFSFFIRQQIFSKSQNVLIKKRNSH